MELPVSGMRQPTEEAYCRGGMKGLLRKTQKADLATTPNKRYRITVQFS
uniref:Uncharacterized protein n=1 Tax=Plectus sambesii TaxID=2011161 RepID=A0A914UPT0_9BILA